MTELIASQEARAALENWLGRAGTLAAAAASHPDARALEGRGRVYVVPRPDGGPGRWVVRHYHRGGAVATHLGDRYFRVGTPRPLREFRISSALRERGIPTPAPVGAAVYPAGIWYRGDLVTEWVADSRDLAAVLFGTGGGELDRSPPDDARAGQEETGAALAAAGRLVRRLHDAGVRHPDLNLKNILIVDADAELTALVIDLDGVRLGRPVGGRGRHRMVERFWRSARKWERRTGMRLAAGAREAFEAGYAR